MNDCEIDAFGLRCSCKLAFDGFMHYNRGGWTQRKLTHRDGLVHHNRGGWTQRRLTHRDGFVHHNSGWWTQRRLTHRDSSVLLNRGRTQRNLTHRDSGAVKINDGAAGAGTRAGSTALHCRMRSWDKVTQWKNNAIWWERWMILIIKHLHHLLFF